MQLGELLVPTADKRFEYIAFVDRNVLEPGQWFLGIRYRPIGEKSRWFKFGLFQPERPTVTFDQMCELVETAIAAHHAEQAG